MINSEIKAKVLSAVIIPNLDRYIIDALDIKPNKRSIGIITADSDDVTYAALDEATKKADVKVVYAESNYAGSKNASTKLAGEIIGIIAGPDPAEVRAGLDACVSYIENDAFFISANEDDSIVYFAHCISRTGSYLSNVAGIKEGEALAYLIAPPLESIYGLDAALKAADVRLAAFYAPPSRTNFGGGLLTGSQSACNAACNAFAEAVMYIANNPTKY